MKYAFSPPPTINLPIADDDALFPVRRIFCVGRNYAAHAREMGKDPDREMPFFFMKPTDAIVQDGETVAYPPLTESFHYEAELVVAIGKSGVNVGRDEAAQHVFGYAIGNDLTRRDLQLEAREKGRPWDWGKAFDRSAVCGPIHRRQKTGILDSGSIALTVNGLEKQKGNLADLIWSVPEIISILSESVTIEPGDLIFTGTPAGVGALLPGDECIVIIEGLGKIATRIGERIAP